MKIKKISFETKFNSKPMAKREHKRSMEDLKISTSLIMSGLISFFTIISTETVLNILLLFTVSIGGTPFILGILPAQAHWFCTYFMEYRTG